MYLAAFFLAYGAKLVSGRLHHALIKRVLAAPMAFFDTTPLGRLLSRCSGDLETIDRQVPWTVQWVMRCVYEILGTVFIICFSTPFFLAPLVPLGVFYFIVQVRLGCRGCWTVLAEPRKLWCFNLR